MKSIKIRNLGFLIILVMVLGLTSCEGNTDREWIVLNETSSSISVVAGIVSNGTITTKSIESNSSKIIAFTSQLGGTSTPQPPTSAIDSLMISNASGATFTRDYTDSENWESTIEQVKKTPSQYEHEYILVVRDEDF